MVINTVINNYYTCSPSPGSVSAEGNTWGTGNRMLYYDTVTCAGTELTLTECSRSSITPVTDAIDWYNYERAGISCDSKSSAGNADMHSTVYVDVP